MTEIAETDIQVTASDKLAQYVVDASWSDVPPAVIERAKLCVLDTIGCMIAGSRNAVGTRIVEHAASFGSGGRSSIFGRPGTVDAERAGLANGTLAHVLELDDGHRPSDNHLGCVVVPAALAVAEAVGASGRDLLLSVILGYDVMGRVGEAVCLPRLETPFHGTGTTGPFGAAASAAKLLGLSVTETANAFGVAGTAAAGLREVFVSGSDCKSLHAGRACQNGIAAAYLARSGYEGPRAIIEGTYGFCTAMTSLPRPELAAADLGSRYAVGESAFKVHAVCGLLFTAIDAALALRSEHDLTGDVDAVRVALPGWVKTDPVFTRKRPDRPGLARFSVPFAVAAALVDGEITPRQISEEGLADLRIEELEAKVEIFSDPEIEEIFETTKTNQFFYYPAVVEIDVGGQTYRRLERSPVGYDIERDLTPEQLVEKFLGLASDVVGRDAAEGVLSWCMRLDADAQAAELNALLAGSRPDVSVAVSDPLEV